MNASCSGTNRPIVSVIWLRRERESSARRPYLVGLITFSETYPITSKREHEAEMQFFFFSLLFLTPQNKKKLIKKRPMKKEPNKTNVICDRPIHTTFLSGSKSDQNNRFVKIHLSWNEEPIMFRLVCSLVLDSPPLLHNLLTYGPQHVHVIRLSVPGCDNCLHKANLGSHFSH